MKIIPLLILLLGSGILPSKPPTAPTLSLSAPSTGFIDDVVLVDARASINVSNKPQSDGTMSFTMDFGDGSSLVYVMASGHAYRDAGVYTIRINGKDAAGAAGTEVTQVITITAIPAATGGGIQTLTDSGNLTTNGTNLQNALNAAAAANTVEQEIVLPNDFDAKGTIVMPATSGNKYITIKWANLVPPHKKRLDPVATDQSLMPTIFSPNNTSSIVPAVGVPLPQTASVVKYYRWQGIHFARENNSADAGHLFALGQDTYNGNDGIERMPHHFIIDRCWFDSGGISSHSWQSSGLRVIANYVSIVDNWIAYFRLVGGGVDVQGLVIAGQGPTSTRNNTIVAGSEPMQIGSGATDYRSATISSPTTTTCTLASGLHILPGGVNRPGGGAGTIASASPTETLSVGSVIALPSNSCNNGGPYCVEMVTRVTNIAGNNITYEAVPFAPTNGGDAQWSDLPQFHEVRNNYFFKPDQWRHFLADGTTTNPVWDTDATQIKNLWETKSCAYCVVDGNVFKNTWYQAQPYNIVLSVRNLSGQYSYTAAIHNFQYSNNMLWNANAGLAITGSDDGSSQDQVSYRTRDIFAVNNLNWNVGYEWDVNTSGEMFRMGEANPGKLERVFVMHNTFDGYNFFVLDFGNDTGGATNSMWFNNTHIFGETGFRSSVGTPTQLQVENITNNLPPGTAASWTKNLVVNRRFSSFYGTYAPMPATGLYIGGLNADGSANGDTVAYGGQFVDYSCGNFTLAGSSPGKNAGSDSTDTGVNMTALTAALGASSPCLGTATIKTVTGDWSGSVVAGSSMIISGRVTVTGRITLQ